MSRQVPWEGKGPGWSHLTTVFPCSLVHPIQAAPWRSGARGDGALGIRSLPLLSAAVSARLEVLNVPLLMGFFFLETLSGPSLHDSALALVVSWPCSSIQGTFKCGVTGTAHDPGSISALPMDLYAHTYIQVIRVRLCARRNPVGGGKMSSEREEFPVIPCNRPTLMETHSHFK